MLIEEQARAKINLALHVLGRRADGYHELDSIVAFADVGDRITLEPSTKLEVTISGLFAGDLVKDESNSLIRAWHGLAKISALQPVKFTLEKNLPVASGIGGGSADAAAALRGLIKMFGLTVNPAALHEIAQHLGADVPVCLASSPMHMQGTGERLKPYESPANQSIVLVHPGVACLTVNVFQALGLAKGQDFGAPIQDFTDPATWRNDLAAAAITICPAINEAVAALASQNNLVCARMSGSGATCFGLFQDYADASAAATKLKSQHPGWWVKPARLVS